MMEVGFKSTGESFNEVIVVWKCKVLAIGVEGGVVGVDVVVGHFDLKELGEKLGVDFDWDEAALDHADELVPLLGFELVEVGVGAVTHGEPDI